MSKVQTRISVTVAHNAYQVLSLREGGDGGLTIMPSRAPFSDHPLGRMKIKEDRISLHPSPRSLTPACTIKRTIRYTNEDRRETSAFVKHRGNHLLTFLFGEMCRRMDKNENICRARAKDKVVSIGSYNPDFETFCYLLFVTNAFEDNTGNLEQFPMQLPFKKFQLLFYPFLIPHPSLLSGSGVELATSKPRWNDATIDTKKRIDFDGIEESQIDRVIAESIDQIKIAYVHYFKKYFGVAKALRVAEGILPHYCNWKNC